MDAEKKADEKPAKTEDEIKTWDTDFVKVDQSTLFELILVRQVASASTLVWDVLRSRANFDVFLARP